MQVQRRLLVRVPVVLPGLQNSPQLSIIRIKEVYVAGSHYQLAQTFAQLINFTVMLLQIRHSTQILANQEHIIACRLDFQIIIEAGDFLQFFIAGVIAYCLIQLASLAGRP